ncbi:MAG: hypothetical protein IJY05_03095 [Clostridia bacterium]|nr:hypothetical protein [Clostridia bacterium]
MITIKRKMQTEEINKSERYSFCQASLNSDGVITLRSYNTCNKNQDEITILSRDETQAIFSLMRSLKSSGVQNADIPF